MGIAVDVEVAIVDGDKSSAVLLVGIELIVVVEVVAIVEVITGSLDAKDKK